MKISKEYKVGFLFIVVILVFIWGFNYLKGKDLFSNQRNFYAVYTHVDGLYKANPVSINGLQVGQVKALYFDKNLSGNIIVELTVNTDFPIPKNSIAKIYSEDLMGSKAVDLHLGDSKVLATSGDTLLAELEASLADEVNKQVQPLKRKAESLLGSLDSVVTVVQTIFNENARNDLAKSFKSISETFYSLQHSSYKLDTFIVSETNRLSQIITNIESISKNLDSNQENINKVITNFASISDTLAKAEVATTIGNMNATLFELSQVIAKINSGEGSLGQLMQNDSLYLHLQKSAANLDSLLVDIKENPKRYVKFSIF